MLGDQFKLNLAPSYTQFENDTSSDSTSIHVDNATNTTSDQIDNQGENNIPNLPQNTVGVMSINDGGTATSVSDSNSSKIQIRMIFVRKVILVLIIQEMIRTGLIGFFNFTPPIKNRIQHFSYQSVTFVTYGLGIGILIISALSYTCDGLRRKSPINIIAFVLLTILSSFYMSTHIIGTNYQIDTFYSAGISISIYIMLFTFTFQKQRDFTKTSGLLIVGIISVIIGIIFITYCTTMTNSCMDSTEIIPLFITLIFSSISSGFLVIDLTRIMNGNHSFAIRHTEFIHAAFVIYLDMIFIMCSIVFVFLIFTGHLGVIYLCLTIVGIVFIVFWIRGTPDNRFSVFD